MDKDKEPEWAGYYQYCEQLGIGYYSLAFYEQDEEELEQLNKKQPVGFKP